MKDIGYVNASYGYCLYLMKQYDEARKYLDIAFVDIGSYNPCWTHCYYGLLEHNLGNMQMSNYYLHEFSRLTDESDLIRLDLMKQQDPKNIDYIMKCRNFAIRKTK